MTTMENLPVEVLSEIFIRLLAKQIAQMRCISKVWNALLSESSFIKSHLHRSIHKKDEILLFFKRKFTMELSLTPFTARLSRSPGRKLTNLIKIPQIKYGCGALIGSVNGLICFYYMSSPDVGYVVHIWNPSLSAVLTLPPFPVNFHYLDFGFGFDPKTDDYKVLKITCFSEEPEKVKQTEVYSMKKGFWKLISPQTFPSHITILGNNQVCVDDNLHWLCHTHLEYKPWMILGFDLGEEAFSVIPPPDSIPDFKAYKPSNVLGVLGGRLSVMSCVEDGKCEVWVMDEYGVPESWVKHHVFSQFSGDIIPYGFTLKNEFLFQVYQDRNRFGLYDPVAAKTKTFKIVTGYYKVSKFVEYVDSLVWVAPPKCESSSCDISQLQSAG